MLGTCFSGVYKEFGLQVEDEAGLGRLEQSASVTVEIVSWPFGLIHATLGLINDLLAISAISSVEERCLLMLEALFYSLVYGLKTCWSR